MFEVILIYFDIFSYILPLGRTTVIVKSELSGDLLRSFDPHDGLFEIGRQKYPSYSLKKLLLLNIF